MNAARLRVFRINNPLLLLLALPLVLAVIAVISVLMIGSGVLTLLVPRRRRPEPGATLKTDVSESPAIEAEYQRLPS